MLVFTDDVQVQLCRHLLRTVCTDIVNQAVGLLAADHMLTINDDSALTLEVRVKQVIKQVAQLWYAWSTADNHPSVWLAIYDLSLNLSDTFRTGFTNN